MRILHQLRIRQGENRFKTPVAHLPQAPDGMSGVIFAKVKPGDEEALQKVGEKFQASVESGVLKPGTRVISQGEKLLIIAEPA